MICKNLIFSIEISMMEKIKNTTDIQQKYISIYNGFFGYIGFVIMFLVVVILLFVQINKWTTSENNFFLIDNEQANILINEYEDTFWCDLTLSGVDVVLCNGYNYIQSWNYVWTNTLWTVNGRSMLMNTHVENVTWLNNIDLFNGNKDYFIEDFNNIIDKFLYNTWTYDELIYKQLNLSEDVESFFEITCINNNLSISTICKNNIDNFLETFFVYDFDWKYDQLIQIQEKLSSKENDAFCKGLIDHAKYSQTVNSETLFMIDECTQDIQDSYYDLYDLISLNAELEEWYISNKKYINNNLLNEYKLLSIQKFIVEMFDSWKFDIYVIDSYVRYLSNLLHKEPYLRGIYYDWTYIFNNNYLIPKLNSNKLLNAKVSNSVEIFISNINDINKGNTFAIAKGLEGMIVNEWIINIVEKNDIEYIWDIEFDLSSKINELWNLWFFTMIGNRLTWTWATAIVDWYFMVWLPNGTNLNLESSLSIGLNNGNIIVENVYIDWYSSLTNALNNFVLNWEKSVFEINDFIVQNISIYYWNDSAFDEGFCENITNFLGSSINNDSLDIISCDNSRILIKYNDNKYKILFENWSIDIENLWTNKIDLTEYIKQNYDMILVNNFNTESVILEIIKTRLIQKEEEDKYLWSENVLEVLWLLQRYMNLEPSDIVEHGNAVIVDLSVNWIEFIMNIDTENKVVKQIFFKDIKVEWRPLEIRWFDMELSDDNIVGIREFVFDPIEYIKKYYPNTYLEYSKQKRD